MSGATKTEQAAAILRERFPDGTAPYGTFKIIAREIGCAGELVRQVAGRVGVRLVPKQPERRQCPECGDSFMWTVQQRQQFRDRRKHSRLQGIEPSCSQKCGARQAARQRFGPERLRGPWSYKPQHRRCPRCRESFCWTAQQQWQRDHNVANGLVTFPDLIACSRSCAVSLGRLRGIAERERRAVS